MIQQDSGGTVLQGTFNFSDLLSDRAEFSGYVAKHLLLQQRFLWSKGTPNHWELMSPFCC